MKSLSEKLKLRKPYNFNRQKKKHSKYGRSETSTIITREHWNSKTTLKHHSSVLDITKQVLLDIHINNNVV